MEQVKLKVDLRNIKKIEKFKKFKYQGNIIKYNEKYFIFNGSLLRFENRAVVSGNLIFIQDLSNMIYSTADFKNFGLIGNGDIIGMIDHALIFRNDDVFHIYANGISISLFFHFEDEKLLYSHTKTLSSPISIKNYIIYNEFLVVSSENNVLFLSMNSVKDVQFRFPGNIKTLEIIENEKIKFLIATYNRKGSVYSAIFYHNHLITRKANLIIENLKKVLLVSKNIQNSSEVHFIDKYCNSNSEFIEYKPFDNFYSHNEPNRTSINSSSSALLVDIKDCTDDQLVYPISKSVELFSNFSSSLSSLKTSKESQHNKFSENHNNNCDIKFQISEIETLAFNLASIDQQISFLQSIFEGKSYNIIHAVKEKLLHVAPNISSLLSSCTFEFQSIVNSLTNNSSFSNFEFNFFYEPVEKYLKTKKSLNFKFELPYTKKEIEFIERKYYRVFQYCPIIQNSKNLAYRIIKFEQRNQVSLEKSGNQDFTSKYTDCNKFFMKLIKSHYGDKRVEEMINLMLENQITIGADVDDLKTFRFDSFCARSYLNIGSLILNHKMTYYHSIHDLPIKSNNQNTDDSVSHELIFLNSACISSYYKKLTVNSIYSQLGKAFGLGLIKGLSDDEIQKFIKLIPGAEDEQLKFILLVLSTRKLEEPHMKSLSINKIFKSALGSINFELKKAAVCSLAIYNMCSNDSNIINTLKKELLRKGPVVEEKNSPFYDRNYRSLVALSIGTIATRVIFSETPDSFANLIVSGLSSINSKISSDLFYRASDCRPDELFYSQLFTLTSDFEKQPDSLLSEFSFEKLKSGNDVLIAAAKIFYIGLFLIKEPNRDFESIYRRLFNILEKLEEMVECDKKYRILFNYALCACSIAKNGTCDFNLLKILRKEILITKEIKYLPAHSYFDCKKKEYCTDKKIDKESMQFYKICVGILTMNFGMSRLTASSIKQLIVTFFYTGEVPLEFSYIDILRCQLVRVLQDNTNEIASINKTAFNRFVKEKKRKMSKYFNSKFSKLSEIDKKFVIDILTDYYENYNHKAPNETLFDLKLLAKLISIAK